MEKSKLKDLSTALKVKKGLVLRASSLEYNFPSSHKCERTFFGNDKKRKFFRICEKNFKISLDILARGGVYLTYKCSAWKIFTCKSMYFSVIGMKRRRL